MRVESSPDWISSMKGDGKPPWACYYYTAFPMFIHDPRPHVLVCPIDCYGRSGFKPNTWKGLSKYTMEPMEFYGIGLIVNVTPAIDTTPGMFRDVRSPEMIIDRCCPPQLMVAILDGLES